MTSEAAGREGTTAAVLLPIMAVIFGVYIVMGLAMPVLPLYVHQGLGLGPFVVGLVSGSQFAAAMFSRFWAGHHADSKGPRHALLTGLLVAAASGLLYVFSFYVAGQPKDLSCNPLVGACRARRRGELRHYRSPHTRIEAPGCAEHG